MVPTLMIITGVVLLRIDFIRYPLSDGLPMALLGWLMLAMMLIGVAFRIAWLGFRRKTNRPRR